MNPSSDIRSWLESLDLGDFAPVFEENHLTTPDVLHRLTSDDLNELGITSLGHRKKLLAAIAQLNMPTPARHVPAAAPMREPRKKQGRPSRAVIGPQLVPLKAASKKTDAPKIHKVVEPVAYQDVPAKNPAPAPVSKSGHSVLSGRKGFSGSFMAVSVAVHLVLAVGAGYWVVQKMEVKRKLQFAEGPPTTNPSQRALEHRVSLQQKKNAGGAPAQAQRIAVAGLASKITLPDMPSVPTTSTQFVAGRMSGMGGAGFGTGIGFGNGSGNGIGGMGGGTGKLFAMIPQAMSKRCSKADRLQRLKDNGGTPACEDAVVKALQWFKKNQNPDGSWGQSDEVAMTGLALLAFFGHCETPVSPEFGETCTKGITYLVSVGMRNGGMLGGNPGSQTFCYEHAIGTYALAEAATFCKEIKFNIPSLTDVTQKAGQYIIENQNANGGWAYSYARSAGHTDVSVVSWQMQALKACSHTGIEFKNLNEATNRGLEYLATCQNESGAFGYTGPPPNGPAHQSLTGAGMLSFQIWGQSKGSVVRRAAKHTIESTTFDFKSDADLYSHYYESQAMIQRSSSEWKRYNDMFRDQLLNNQQSDGSWGIPPGSKHVKNTVFSTCLCTLMLEVYYRFLTTGGASGGRGRLGY